MEDEKWRNLLAGGAATFRGEDEPPYGFISSTLARLRDEKRQQEDLERIGWRALLASVATLLVVAGLTLNSSSDNADLEPGVRSLVVMEHIQIS